MKLSGEVFNWNLCGNRVYATVTMSFSQACEAIMPYHFDATNGEGEQREVVAAHARKLKKEMLEGRYTPTPVSAGVHPSHKKRLTIENGRFAIDVDPGEPLPQTNGQHRFEALHQILAEVKDKLKKAKTEEEKKELEKRITLINALPISILLNLDGNPAIDFVNLQASKAVDKAHMMVMRIFQDESDPSVKMAYSTARALHNAEGSPFRDQIKFDSRGNLALPITTLCSKGASDIGTSLIGLSRIAEHFSKAERHAAHAVISVYQAIKENQASLQDYGKVLTPIRDGGKRGAATMYIGLASCLLYRIMLEGRDLPTDEDKKHLADVAAELLDEPVAGGFASARKRELLGRFARQYFSDLAVTMHEGIPTELVRILSSSTFNVSKLPNVTRRGSKVEQESETTDKPAPASEAPKGAEAAPAKTETKESPAPEKPKATSKPSTKGRKPADSPKKDKPTTQSRAKGTSSKASTGSTSPTKASTKKSGEKKGTEAKASTTTKKPSEKLASLPTDKAPWD